MMDPTLSLILKAGALSLRELFIRLGSGSETSRQLAHLLKNGEARVEAVEGGSRNPLGELGIALSDSEEQIANRLEKVGTEDIADNFEISPTAKAWRNPFAAA